MGGASTPVWSVLPDCKVAHTLRERALISKHTNALSRVVALPDPARSSWKLPLR